jgi:hypothetical protein
MPETVTASQHIFSLLSDRQSLNIIKSAYSGFTTSSFLISNPLAHNISKKQFYVKLKRLRDAGLIEKSSSLSRSSYNNNKYQTTTFGSLVYNSIIKALDKTLANYWQLKAIDLMKTQEEIPAKQKDIIINEIISNSKLRDITNLTHLSSFNIIKDFDNLTIEVLKILENAKEEIYFATRYHQPHVSSKVFEKFSKGRITLHIIDGNPESISVENRINAILRTPPNRDTFEKIAMMIKSPRFELLRLSNLPVSFLVVDRHQVIYETINYSNPEQFTLAIANYNDRYLAQQHIHYFNLLAKDAIRPKILEIGTLK